MNGKFFLVPYEECRIICKTRENRISLTRWKKKKIEFCRCRNRRLFCFVEFPLFVWLQPISTIQPIQSRGSFIQFDKCEKSHFSFLSFSSFTNCCEQVDFKPLFTFLLFNNSQIKKKKQNKTNSKHSLQMRLRFRSFRPIWSKSRFLKSQSKKNDDWFRFARIDNNLQNLQNEKQNEWDFIPWLFSSLQKRKKEKIVKFSFIFQQTTSIHSHSFNHQSNHKQSQWEEEKVKMNIINNHRTSRKPHRLTRAWREGKQTTLTQLPAFPAFCNYLNTRSPPMRIDTPQVTSADRDLSHWCFRRQFNRAMSESGVHDKREYPTRWEMTIHYTANDYSLFNTKQSKAYRRKQSSWDCIACHHSLHPEWAKDLRFAQTGFGVYWLWICLLLSAFSLTSFLQFFFQSIQYSSTVQCRADGRPSVEVS